MGLVCKTPSTITPFLLAEVKDHLRRRDAEEDGYIQQLIFAATSAAEFVTRRALFTSTWTLYLDKFPANGILMPRPKLQSITSVKYYDGTALQTLASSDYQVDAVNEPGRLFPAPCLTWPDTEYERLNSVEIEFVAGYTSRAALPAGLRQAMLYHISHMFDVREPVAVGTIAVSIPFTIEAMYAPYRVMSFY